MDVFGAWGDPSEGWWRAGWSGRHGRHEGRRGIKRLRRGILKLAVLKLLSEMPRHGYDLMRAVRAKGWGSGPGSVYPLLAALEKAGLIAGRDDGDRRVYDITEEGRQMLGERASELERLLHEEGEDDEPENDSLAQLRDSAGKLMRAIAQLGPSSKSETIEHVCELLKEARKEIYELLAEE
jgi:DNA-binding PadR family transcriptional regulator